MLSSLQAVFTLAVALLPGALFVWAFERQTGQRYGIRSRDRFLRFVGGSALVLAVLATPLYWIYARYWGEFVAGNRLPPAVALVPVAYVALPSAAGWLAGTGLRKGWGWATLITGPNPAPRAWDHLFQNPTDAWIRCRLKSGTWVGGAYADAYGRRSYAAGYPEPQDLFLAIAVELDEDTGEFVLNEHGQPIHGEGGLLLRWEEIEYLEII